MTNKTFFQPEDLIKLVWLEDPKISPDGSIIACIETKVDLNRGGYKRKLRFISSDGLLDWRLEVDIKKGQSFCWSPTGDRFAIICTHDDLQGQLYIGSLYSNSIEQITKIEGGVSKLSWSPNGEYIAFLAKEDSIHRRVDEGVCFEEGYQYDPESPSSTDHIYIISLSEGNPLYNTARRVSLEDLLYTAPTWMPDSSAILTTIERNSGGRAYFQLLRLSIIDDTAEFLTDDKISCFDPLVSSNNCVIAFVYLPRDGILSANGSIGVLNPKTGVTKLTSHIDLNVEQFKWHPSGKQILFLARWRGNCQLYSVDVGDDWQNVACNPVISEERWITSFDIGIHGELAFVSANSKNPCDLFVANINGKEHQITRINQELLSSKHIATAIEVEYSVADGEMVQGWVLHPPGYCRQQQYPLVVYVHGGPYTAWGPGFYPMWHEWQVAAGRGYIVFFCNPHGSEGYGHVWRGSLCGKWAELDLPDITAGINHLVSSGSVDASCIALAGGSYGAYLVVWLLCQSSDFACAIAARGMYNLVSEYATSDLRELLELEFNSEEDQFLDRLWQRSPLSQAHKINTPLLLLHGEIDNRTPLNESKQLFAILKRRGKIVNLIQYPNEGHDITRNGTPEHRIDHLRRTMEWLDMYCK